MKRKPLSRRKADAVVGNSLFQSRPIRLLLVDDDPADLRLMCAAVEQIVRPKVELRQANTVEMALRLLDDEAIDLCIADFRLAAGQTALDLFRAARNHSHLIPFIAITGVMDEETTANTLLIAGFDDVLLKSDLIVANIYRIVRNSWLRNAHTRELVEHSTIDTLTGVLSRRGAMLRLEVEYARARRNQQPLTLLFADLDGFKAINDEFGHAGGDRALTHFARLLDTVLRKSDLVGRMGGDEFVIAMPGALSEHAEQTMRRIQSSLESSPLQIDRSSVALRCSIGHATFDPARDDQTLMQLIGAADAAMYQTKLRQRRFGWRDRTDPAAD